MSKDSILHDIDADISTMKHDFEAHHWLLALALTLVAVGGTLTWSLMNTRAAVTQSAAIITRLTSDVTALQQQAASLQQRLDIAQQNIDALKASGVSAHATPATGANGGAESVQTKAKNHR
jgi:hypothetical protein